MHHTAQQRITDSYKSPKNKCSLLTDLQTINKGRIYFGWPGCYSDSRCLSPSQFQTRFGQPRDHCLETAAAACSS